MGHHPKVTKSNGAVVPFEKAKLLASLIRAGASEGLANLILKRVRQRLYPNISTAEIYSDAYDMLREHSHCHAGRYKLKQALMELGSSGFPFEKYVGELMRAEGFTIELDIILPGKCVRHELDVVARKENLARFVECKYHSQRGQKTDVKVSLYVHSRFRDLEDNLQHKRPQNHPHFEGWLVTNTRFSDDAVAYGRCAGLHLVSWDYPGAGSLKDMIEKTGLYPITCLANLSEGEKNSLAEKGVLLCRDVEQRVPDLLRLGISDARTREIVDEANKIAGVQA
jgi:hypothetical protein